MVTMFTTQIINNDEVLTAASLSSKASRATYIEWLALTERHHILHLWLQHGLEPAPQEKSFAYKAETVLGDSAVT